MENRELTDREKHLHSAQDQKFAAKPNRYDGMRLKKDSRTIPGDPHIEWTFKRDSSSQDIRVQLSTEANENGDPFIATNLRTGKTITLNAHERHRAYLELGQQPPHQLVQNLERYQLIKNHRSKPKTNHARR